MNPIMSKPLSLDEGAMPISASDFTELATRLNDGKSVLTIDGNKNLVLIDKTKNHAEQKIFKKIAYFFSGKKSAENALKQAGKDMEKRFPKLGGLILHIEKSQRKTGLGVSSYLNKHAKAIEKELVEKEHLDAHTKFNKANFGQLKYLHREEFKSFLDAKKMDELSKLFEFPDKKEEIDFKNGISAFFDYVNKPSEDSSLNLSDFKKILSCEKYCTDGKLIKVLANLFMAKENSENIKTYFNEFQSVISTLKTIKVEEALGEIDTRYAASNAKELKKVLDTLF